MVLIFLLIGCVNTTRGGARVRVVRDAVLIKGCTFIEQLKGGSSWGGFAATGVAYDNAMNDLKNRAAGLTGDTLLMQSESNSMGGTRMIGDAYRCGPTQTF